MLAVWTSSELSIDCHGGLAGAMTYDGPLGHASEKIDFEALDATLEWAAQAKARDPGSPAASRTPRSSRGLLPT